MTREEARIWIKVELAYNSDTNLPSVNDALRTAFEALQEPEAITLTYDEKCIFLAAMGRERRICRAMDKEAGLKQKPLVPIVDEIERKVKAVLWGKKNDTQSKNK